MGRARSRDPGDGSARRLRAVRPSSLPTCGPRHAMRSAQLPRDIVQPILEQTPPPSTDDLRRRALDRCRVVDGSTPQAPLSSLHALIARSCAPENAQQTPTGSRLQWRGRTRCRACTRWPTRRARWRSTICARRSTPRSAPLPLDYLHGHHRAWATRACIESLAQSLGGHVHRRRLVARAAGRRRRRHRRAPEAHPTSRDHQAGADEMARAPALILSGGSEGRALHCPCRRSATARS